MTANIRTTDGLVEVEVIEELEIFGYRCFVHEWNEEEYRVSEWRSGYAIAMELSIDDAKRIALRKADIKGAEAMKSAIEFTVRHYGEVNT
jgi:hypothetical protein